MKVSTTIIAATVCLAAWAPAQSISEGMTWTQRIGNADLGCQPRFQVWGEMGQLRDQTIFAGTIRARTSGGAYPHETRASAFQQTFLFLAGDRREVLRGGVSVHSSDAYTATLELSEIMQIMVTWFGMQIQTRFWSPEYHDANAIMIMGNRAIMYETQRAKLTHSETVGPYHAFKRKRTVMVGPLPVTLTANASASVTVTGTATLASRKQVNIDANIEAGPSMSLSGGVGGGVPGIGAEAGVRFTGKFGTATLDASEALTAQGADGELTVTLRAFELLLELYGEIDYLFDSWEGSIELVELSGPSKTFGPYQF